MKKKILLFRICLTLLFAFILFYVTLPAINFKNPGFYVYIVFVIGFYLFTSVSRLADYKSLLSEKPNIKMIKNKSKLILVFPLVFILILLINLFCSPLFNSKSYRSRISVDDTELFTENINEVDFSSTPLLDKDSSIKLGDRVMGQMPELVSQFNVSSLYTQINYNNKIIRVTPLEYADWIKYFTNRREGVKGYITVDSVSGESSLIKLDKGMKYMPSAMFGENLSRKLRFKYPTLIFDTVSFEIDNDGKPYWIAPIIEYTGVGLKRKISGVVMLDPLTGNTTKYDASDVPSWIDHVYPADLIIEELNSWGLYIRGYFNSIFGQKGVVKTTTGYNYLVMDDDVYLYTGITSAVSDESNIGFVLTNLRTKKTNYYSVPGAEEYSAMSSAEGQVQQMNYDATFPLLINLNNRPTYLISLKDNAGLVKMYAFVDVEDYQKVVVTDAALGIERAADNYLNNTNYETDTANTKSTITISYISAGVVEGNTYYYITSTSSEIYKSKLSISENILPFLKVGDNIDITYAKGKNINEIKSIEKR